MKNSRSQVCFGLVDERSLVEQRKKGKKRKGKKRKKERKRKGKKVGKRMKNFKYIYNKIDSNEMRKVK